MDPDPRFETEDGAEAEAVQLFDDVPILCSSTSIQRSSSMPIVANKMAHSRLTSSAKNLHLADGCLERWNRVYPGDVIAARTSTDRPVPDTQEVSYRKEDSLVPTSVRYRARWGASHSPIVTPVPPLSESTTSGAVQAEGKPTSAAADAAAAGRLEGASAEHPGQLASDATSPSCDADKPRLGIARPPTVDDPVEGEPAAPPRQGPLQAAGDVMPADAEAAAAAEPIRPEVALRVDEAAAMLPQNNADPGDVVMVQALPENPDGEAIEMRINVRGDGGHVDWQVQVSTWNVVDRRL